MTVKEIFDILYEKEKWEVYRKFQQIEKSIDTSDELYKYINEIKEMLLDKKSYIRIRGFRLLCKLSKYDKNNIINSNINLLLSILDDDKPTAVRQCLKSLNELLLNKPELINNIKEKLLKINYLKYKDTMSPLIKKDIDNILSQL